MFNEISESPIWATFLDRLRRETRADYVVLIFHPPGRRPEEALQLSSGNALLSQIEQVLRRHPDPVDPPPPRTLREGRPYSLKEPFGSDRTLNGTFYRGLRSSLGITAIRQMRVQEATGVNAWLTIDPDEVADQPVVTISHVPDCENVLREAFGPHEHLLGKKG
jgi:hypothetical protein